MSTKSDEKSKKDASKAAADDAIKKARAAAKEKIAEEIGPHGRIRGARTYGDSGPEGTTLPDDGSDQPDATRRKP